MSLMPKTLTKNIANQSSICNNQTAVPEQKKYKSLSIQNRLFLQKDGKTFGFPIYRDCDVGIDSQKGGCTIELKVDEDCQSSKSVVDYGIKLCQQDLEEYIKQNFSYDSQISYEN